uniref:Uncharacterized protein n=1 Tax=Arundo donax TaxID=35708 RepID=A0A0A8Z156_ARUDO
MTIYRDPTKKILSYYRNNTNYILPSKICRSV